MEKKKTGAKAAAIILAAGRGTRMKSAVPKVLHPLANRPLVSHVLAVAAQAGLSPVTLVVGPDMDALAKLGQASGAAIAIQKQQIGTAHAVLAAKDTLKNFKGHVVVLYGDTPLIKPATITRLLAALAKDNRCAVAVLGFTPADPCDYGRLVVDKSGTLSRIVEFKDANTAEKKIALCNSGVVALRGNLAWKLLSKIGNKNAKKEYYLTDIVALAIKAGYRARAIKGDVEEVLGINSRSDLALADALFQQRVRTAMMESGVTLQAPDTVYFSADTQIAPDVLIEPNVYFGPGVKIARGAHIKSFSHLEGCRIGANTVVGPFARLRPGTELGEQVRVGNFVEIKQSVIEDGAKISHLSYIGDASIGADANIGAGTITCNYDGYNKHRTVIGREVFIGSNSALVAPVVIGDGAMVAAGSVITENVAADALGLARSRQQEKAEWAKDFRNKQKPS